MSPSNDLRLRLREWIARGEARLVPLTFPQRELWETSPVDPGDPANHICASIEIRGNFSFDLCQEALRAVIGRQEALRTSFLSGDGKAAQIVRAKADATLRCRDIAPDQDLDEVLASIYSEPFDLVTGPLFRVEMVRVAPDHHELALVFHHAIADGWTLGVFVEDFTTAYILALRGSGRAFAHIQGTREALPAPGMTYSEWAAAERARWQPSEIEKHTAYWRRRLEGSKLLLGNTESPLPPLRRKMTVVSESGGIRSTARQAGATLFSTLLTAFQVALFRWNGTTDVVFGTPHANRTKAQTRNTMGYFSGIVPLRLCLDPGQPFASALATNHDKVVEDFAHAMPFSELAAKWPAPDGAYQHRVFDIRFALQNHPVPDIEWPGISTRLITRSTGTSRFDIACEVTENGGALEVVWLYRPPLVNDVEIALIDGLFVSVLEAARRSPEFLPQQ